MHVKRSGQLIGFIAFCFVYLINGKFVMKKTLLSIAALTSLTTGYTVAEEPSFTYVEGGYSDIEEFNGYIVRGSFELNDNIYFTGSYNDITADESGFADIDFRFITAGVGYKTLVSDNTAIYAEVNYADSEIESGSFSESEDGHKAALGVRSMITDSTEFYGEIANLKIEDTTTRVTVGAKQYFTDNFGVFAEYARNDFETDIYNLGVSFKF